MSLMIDNRQSIYDADEAEKLIGKVVNAALQYEGIKRPCQVSVLLVDNEQIQEMNRTYRNIDSPTDVLSFPLLEYEDGYSDVDGLNFDEHNIDEIDMDTGELLLGDIVISLEKAHEQSEEYGHSFQREVAFLTVHGMLHLLGYDHEKEEDRKVMREKEEEILGMINLSR